MRIEVLYTRDCPGISDLLATIREILAETEIAASLEPVLVESEAQAQALRFTGSPTVRVDGLDVEPYVTFEATDFGLGCRTYTEAGVVLDWPSRRMLRDTIEVGHLAEMGMLADCC